MPQAVDIDLEPAAYEEPTWEVLDPAKSRARRRVTRRTKAILSAAAAAAVVVNAGAVWTYWQVTNSGATTAGGTAVEMQLRGRSDLNRQLQPGTTGNLTVTLTNDNDFPIRITTVTPGAGNVVADDEHRDAGCTATGVSLSRGSFAVSWAVARNTIGAFTIPDGLTMAGGVAKACEGASFTVPIQVTGAGD